METLACNSSYTGRAYSLIKDIFKKQGAKLFVYFGVLSFAIFTAMGLSCLFTYMRVSHDYQTQMTQEHTRLKEMINEYAIKSSLLKGEIKAYRAAISTLSKKGKRKSLGYFNVTAYDPKDSCVPFNDGLTSNLIPAGMGVAAVDPGVIPYGSVLYAPEINRYFFACDTGSAMKKNNGRNIDLLMPTVKEALVFGRKKLELELIDLSSD
ncbi:hypothetical protein GF312_08895 [Candidatus Poribacteria bacterium]|nr:hypothetical protein [Candidatus Poribacteria bacterium]